MRIEPIKLTEVASSSSSPLVKRTDESGKSFGEVLTEALGEVNRLQNDAAKASIDLAAGKIQDVSQVAIAVEKANISLQLTMQVRNKVVDAYQEIMRMSV